MTENKLSAFDRPQETIKWAREAIQEFNIVIHRFFNSQRHREVIEKDPETGHNLYKVKLLDPLPAILSRRATEALQNIRHSFDQIIFAGSITIGRPPKKDIHFPWRMSPTELEGTLNNKKSIIPTEFLDAIRREEPYPTGNGYSGGDDIIRELSKIANRKHTVGLFVNGNIAQTRYPDVSGRYVKHLSLLNPRWDPVKNEVILISYSGDVQIHPNYNITFYVSLDISKPLIEIPAQIALNMFADKAEHFTEAIKAECLKIIS